MGNKKQLIEYIREKYKNDSWVKDNGSKFDNDFGSFKLALDMLGLQISDKMSDKEYNKTHRNKRVKK